jgi:hypothetical protein
MADIPFLLQYSQKTQKGSTKGGDIPRSPLRYALHLR